MANVKTVQDKGDKAALLILDDGSKPVWTPDRELARTLLGKPIPSDWIRKEGEYGPQALPPKAKGQGRYRDTKEAFDREAESRTAWQREEEDRKDRRTAVMTAAEHFGDRWPVVAEEMYEWLRSSPAAGPAEFPGRKASAGAASTDAVGQAGGTSSAEGEAVDTKPGEGATPSPSSGFPMAGKNCDHKSQAGRWLATRTVDGKAVCPRCGLSALIYRETA
jgi:hypothetical protein